MSIDAQSPLRIVTFGDLDPVVWGAVWSLPAPAFAFGALDQELTGTATIDGATDSEDWRISGEGIELAVSAVGESVAAGAFDGFDQLCRCRGQLLIGGAERELDTLCRRASRPGVDPRGSESVRDVSTWFEPDQGLALTSVRARKVKGHDADMVAAAVLDVGEEHDVADPRLSTTYRADGSPLRAGLELWLSAEEDVEQYPRRAAGEAFGGPARHVSDSVEVLAEPFRWHSRGSDGCGVYLLMHAR